MNLFVILLIEEVYYKKDSVRLFNGIKFLKEVNLEYI